MRALAAAATVPADLTVESPVPPWRATAGTRRLLALATEVGAELGMAVISPRCPTGSLCSRA
jgi:hypothetical protein